jgi:high-affinity Fe2+/Pb2+ permease
MSEMTQEKQASTGLTLNWQTKAMIIGGVVGAAVGVTAAYLLVQRSKDGQTAKMSVGEGVKIGVLVFSLLRSIANL